MKAYYSRQSKTKECLTGKYQVKTLWIQRETFRAADPFCHKGNKKTEKTVKINFFITLEISPRLETIQVAFI